MSQGKGVLYCSNCGSQIERGGLYCSKCGAAVAASQAPAATRSQQYSPMNSTSIVLVAVVAIVLIAAIVSIGFSTSIFPGSISGSGNLVTKQENFTGFTTVAIASGFKFTITQSSSYSINVTINNNLLGYVSVSQTGNTLSIGLAPGFAYLSASPKVEIAMPALSGLDVSGGVNGNVVFSNSSHDFAISASGGSIVSFSGSCSDLTIAGSGGSRVDMSGFHVANAHVDLSGGSQATVRLDGRLDANVSGGSHLFYIGNPTMGNIQISGGAGISKK